MDNVCIALPTSNSHGEVLIPSVMRWKDRALDGGSLRLNPGTSPGLWGGLAGLILVSVSSATDQHILVDPGIPSSWAPDELGTLVIRS